MKSPWYFFYADRLNDVYRAHVGRKYDKFIESVDRVLPAGGSALEIGCGAANVTAELHRRKRASYLMLDRCPGMIALSRENSGHIENRDLILGDAVKLRAPRVDVIHSHGLLEHMTNEQIRESIKNQLKLTSVLVHYVPSAKYKVPSFGDERLMTPNQWREICKPDEVVEFNDGYDLILTWNCEKWRR